MTQSKKQVRESAVSLVRGRVQWDDLCRYALHNKVERERIQEEMVYANHNKGVITPARYNYLRQQLRSLNLEKNVILAKKSRIESKVNTSRFEFII